MAKRSAKAVRLIQTIPRADFRSTEQINKKFSSTLRKKTMTVDQAKKLAALVTQIRAGEAPTGQIEAVLGKSVELLTAGLHKKEWKRFFNKHGGESLVSIDFNEFDRPFVFLPFPGVTHKKSKAKAKFNFVREGNEVLVDIHLADSNGDYVGTIRKAVAPLPPLVKGGLAQEKARDASTRMVVAGIQKHAKDLLAELLDVSPREIDPPDEGWELQVLLTPLDVLRGQTVFMDFKWPKGLPVRTLFGNLNRTRVTVASLIREYWPQRFASGSQGEMAVRALGRVADILRFRLGYNYRQTIEGFSRALGKPVSPAEFDAVMYEADYWQTANL